MSRKFWVVLTGGLLGIVAIRVVIGQLLTIVRRYPTIVDGAFVIIAWVGVKLLVEYLNAAGYVHFEVDKWLSLLLIVVIFTVAYVRARHKGPVHDDDPTADEASVLLKGKS
jgi:predicted tellurium resistance membrane protein TerC